MISTINDILRYHIISLKIYIYLIKCNKIFIFFHIIYTFDVFEYYILMRYAMLCFMFGLQEKK